MRRSIRIPVWYALPLLAVGLAAFLGGSLLRTGAASSHPATATTLTATVTRDIVQTVTRTIAIVVPTEPPKLAAAATAVPATDTPVPPTATSVPTASPSPVPPTATVKATATSVPAATATPPAYLRAGQVWQQDSMSITMVRSAYKAYLGDWCCDYSAHADFQAENHTNVTLDFDLAANDVDLQLSGGKQVVARHGVSFNNFAADTKITFSIDFNVGWDAFQALERDVSNAYYTVTISHFSSHITNAKWRVDLAH